MPGGGPAGGCDLRSPHGVPELANFTDLQTPRQPAFADSPKAAHFVAPGIGGHPGAHGGPDPRGADGPPLPPGQVAFDSPHMPPGGPQQHPLRQQTPPPQQRWPAEASPRREDASAQPHIVPGSARGGAISATDAKRAYGEELRRQAEEDKARI